MKKMAWAQGIALLIVVGLVVAFNLGVAGMERAMMMAWLVHGVFFLIYIAMLGWAMGRKELSTKHCWVGFVAAMIPLGSLIFERKIRSLYPHIR